MIRNIPYLAFQNLVKIAVEHGKPDFYDHAPPIMPPTVIAYIEQYAEEQPTTLGETLYWFDNADARFDLRLVWWCQIHSYFWRNMRRSGLEGTVPKSLKLDMTRNELELWARVHGVTDVLDISLHTLYGYFDSDRGNLPGYLYFRVGEFISDNVLWTASAKRQSRTTRLKTLGVLEYIAEKRIVSRRNLLNLHQQMQQTTFLPAIQIRVDELIAMSEKFIAQGILPNTSESREKEWVSLNKSKATLTFHGTEKIACTRFQPAENRVEFSLSDTPLTMSAHCRDERPCATQAAAIEMAMKHLLNLPEKEALALEEIISIPGWQRMIQAMLDMENDTLIPKTWDGQQAWFGWRVTNVEDYPEIRPVLVRQKKRGDGVMIKLLHNLDDTQAVLEVLEDPLDREIYRYWNRAQALDTRRWWGIPGDALEDAQRTLALLSKHDHVYYYDRTARPLDITFHVGELIFEDRPNESIGMALKFGDRVLDTNELEDIYETLEYSGFIIQSFHVDKKHAALTLWQVPRKIERAIIKAKPLLFGDMPTQAKEALVQMAPALTESLNIKLSSSLRGHYVSPRDHLTVRLSMNQGILDVAFLASPLDAGATYTPTQAPDIVYAMEDGETVHTTRNFEVEQQRVQWLVEALDFVDMEPTDLFQWRMDGVDASLDCLEQLQRLQIRNPQHLEIVWDTGMIRLHQSSTPSNLTIQVKTSSRFFALDGKLDVQGQVIPLDQLLQATRERRHWIQLDDESWAKMTDELTRSINSIGVFVDGKSTNISPLMAPSLMKLEEDAGIVLEGPASWFALTDQINRAAMVVPDVPPNFEGTLRAYQLDGLRWLTRLAMWAPGACLADDMGLGKTIQALAFLLTRATNGPTLIIGPTSLGFNWQRETSTFAPSLNFHLIRASHQLDAISEPAACDLIYMSYDLAARNVDWCTKRQWHTMILDEAQAIKNAKTQRASAIHDITADFSLTLTGTPLENHTGELWSLMHVIAPTLLGDLGTFNTQFRIPIERHQDVVARTSLASIISPFVLRRLKRDVAGDLPDRTDIRLDIELSDQERAIYEQFRQSALSQLLDSDQAEHKRFELLAAITRLRQLACHPALVDPRTTVESSKVEVLIDTLTRIREEGHHALVFSQFTSLLHILEDALEMEGMDVAKLTGSTPSKKRAELVESFQEGAYDVFLLSIKAGGIGLNLTRASYVFLLDPWWNPAVEDQAADRVHRIGQTEPVTVYRLVAKDTIEEIIYQMHGDKRALMDAVLSGSGSSSPLSIEELHALLTGDLDQETQPVAQITTESTPSTAASMFKSTQQVTEDAQIEVDDAVEETQAKTDIIVDAETNIITNIGTEPETPALTKDVLYAKIDAYLETLLTQNALSKASKNAYRAKLRKMAMFFLEQNPPLDTLSEVYKTAINDGSFNAVASHAKTAIATSKHLRQILASHQTPLQ